MFFHRRRETRDFDRETLRPVLRASICTGEKTAGFQNRQTGKIQEVMLVRGEDDLLEFCRLYGLRPEEISTVY